MGRRTNVQLQKGCTEKKKGSNQNVLLKSLYIEMKMLLLHRGKREK